jgi:CheY-like chemotaxis protein
MGGNLTVESELGVGSTFSFSITLDRPSTPQTQSRSLPPASLAGHTALVVDDNATNRRILQLQLTRWGMNIFVAAGAGEAMALVTSGTHLDLAILDMRMPQTNGRQLAEMIHAVPGFRHLPLVLLTSLGDRPGGQATTPTFSAFLAKPVKTARLADTLCRALARDTHLMNPQPERAMPPGGESPRLRVLLAEDNLINQRLGQLMLTKLGHHTDVVANGAEAVDAVRDGRYDFVLMDVQMPVMDGIQATSEIRAITGLRQPAIVAMTASAMAEDHQACLLAGMDDFLTKPVRADMLAATLTDPTATRPPPTPADATENRRSVE